ncbi:putative homeodomain transcription factor [Diplonema papillatum]|nr:putative homeodomain transcription factor [Diplonema papillatum]
MLSGRDQTAQSFLETRVVPLVCSESEADRPSDYEKGRACSSPLPCSSGEGGAGDVRVGGRNVRLIEGDDELTNSTDGQWRRRSTCPVAPAAAASTTKMRSALSFRSFGSISARSGPRTPTPRPAHEPSTDTFKRYLDLDTMKAISNLNCKPNIRTVTLKKGFQRLVFLPLFPSFWADRRSKAQWAGMTALYLIQMFVVYYFFEGPADVRAYLHKDIGKSEILFPLVVLCFMGVVFGRIPTAVADKKNRADKLKLDADGTVRPAEDSPQSTPRELVETEEEVDDISTESEISVDDQTLTTDFMLSAANKGYSRAAFRGNGNGVSSETDNASLRPPRDRREARQPRFVRSETSTRKLHEASARSRGGGGLHFASGSSAQQSAASRKSAGGAQQSSVRRAASSGLDISFVALGALQASSPGSATLPRRTPQTIDSSSPAGFADRTPSSIRVEAKKQARCCRKVASPKGATLAAQRQVRDEGLHPSGGTATTEDFYANEEGGSFSEGGGGEHAEFLRSRMSDSRLLGSPGFSPPAPPERAARAHGGAPATTALARQRSGNSEARAARIGGAHGRATGDGGAAQGEDLCRSPNDGGSEREFPTHGKAGALPRLSLNGGKQAAQAVLRKAQRSRVRIYEDASFRSPDDSISASSDRGFPSPAGSTAGLHPHHHAARPGPASSNSTADDHGKPSGSGTAAFPAKPPSVASGKMQEPTESGTPSDAVPADNLLDRAFGSVLAAEVREDDEDADDDDDTARKRRERSEKPAAAAARSKKQSDEPPAKPSPALPQSASAFVGAGMRAPADSANEASPGVNTAALPAEHPSRKESDDEREEPGNQRSDGAKKDFERGCGGGGEGLPQSANPRDSPANSPSDALPADNLLDGAFGSVLAAEVREDDEDADDDTARKRRERSENPDAAAAAARSKTADKQPDEPPAKPPPALPQSASAFVAPAGRPSVDSAKEASPGSPMQIIASDSLHSNPNSPGSPMQIIASDSLHSNPNSPGSPMQIIASDSLHSNPNSPGGSSPVNTAAFPSAKHPSQNESDDEREAPGKARSDRVKTDFERGGEVLLKSANPGDSPANTPSTSQIDSKTSLSQSSSDTFEHVMPEGGKRADSDGCNEGKPPPSPVALNGEPYAPEPVPERTEREVGFIAVARNLLDLQSSDEGTPGPNSSSSVLPQFTSRSFASQSLHDQVAAVKTALHCSDPAAGGATPEQLKHLLRHLPDIAHPHPAPPAQPAATVPSSPLQEPTRATDAVRSVPGDDGPPPRLSGGTPPASRKTSLLGDSVPRATGLLRSISDEVQPLVRWGGAPSKPAYDTPPVSRNASLLRGDSVPLAGGLLRSISDDAQALGRRVGTPPKPAFGTPPVSRNTSLLGGSLAQAGGLLRSISDDAQPLGRRLTTSPKPAFGTPPVSRGASLLQEPLPAGGLLRSASGEDQRFAFSRLSSETALLNESDRQPGLLASDGQRLNHSATAKSECSADPAGAVFEPPLLAKLGGSGEAGRWIAFGTEDDNNNNNNNNNNSTAKNGASGKTAKVVAAPSTAHRCTGFCSISDSAELGDAGQKLAAKDSALSSSSSSSSESSDAPPPPGESCLSRGRAPAQVPALRRSATVTAGAMHRTQQVSFAMPKTKRSSSVSEVRWEDADGHLTLTVAASVAVRTRPAHASPRPVSRQYEGASESERDELPTVIPSSAPEKDALLSVLQPLVKPPPSSRHSSPTQSPSRCPPIAFDRVASVARRRSSKFDMDPPVVRALSETGNINAFNTSQWFGPSSMFLSARSLPNTLPAPLSGRSGKDDAKSNADEAITVEYINVIIWGKGSFLPCPSALGDPGYTRDTFTKSPAGRLCDTHRSYSSARGSPRSKRYDSGQHTPAPSNPQRIRSDGARGHGELTPYKLPMSVMEVRAAVLNSVSKTYRARPKSLRCYMPLAAAVVFALFPTIRRVAINNKAMDIVRRVSFSPSSDRYSPADILGLTSACYSPYNPEGTCDGATSFAELLLFKTGFLCTFQSLVSPLILPSSPEAPAAVFMVALFVVAATAYNTYFLTKNIFIYLAAAEQTYHKRYLYAKFFSALTSLRRSQRYNLPHFRLKNVENVMAWLALRGSRAWLKLEEHEVAADSIVSLTFQMFLFVAAVIGMIVIQGSAHKPKRSVSYQNFSEVEHGQIFLAALVLAYYLLLYFTTGTSINNKYGNASLLLTEQLNIHLRIVAVGEKSSGSRLSVKKEKLVLTSKVLELAAKLLKELEGPNKISGLSMNPMFYNITRVMVLSCLSAAISHVFGFSPRLWKI